MVVGRRPKRHHPYAKRLVFTAELEQCPLCGEPLSAEGCAAHSAKNVQTLEGEFYVVAYSRRCRNPECGNFGRHYHAAGHLKISLPYSTYGLDVVALIGIQRQRQHKQFTAIQALLNKRGVSINAQSVGRLYRLFLALMEGAWSRCRERLAEAAGKYGGLILMADGLQPDGEGPRLQVLWEVLSGTPISGQLIDQADTPRLLKMVWPQASHITFEGSVQPSICRACPGARRSGGVDKHLAPENDAQGKKGDRSAECWRRSLDTSAAVAMSERPWAPKRTGLDICGLLCYTCDNEGNDSQA